MSRSLSSGRGSHRAAGGRLPLAAALLGALGVLVIAGDAVAMRLVSMDRVQWRWHARVSVRGEQTVRVGVDRVLEPGEGERLVEARISSTVLWSGAESSGKLHLDQLLLTSGGKRYAVAGAFSGNTFYDGARLAQTVTRKKSSARRQAGVETRVIFRVPATLRAAELRWSARSLRVRVVPGVPGVARPENAPVSARVLRVRREPSLAPGKASAGKGAGPRVRSRWGQLVVVTARVEPQRYEVWRTNRFTVVYGDGAWSPAAGEIGAKGWADDRSHWVKRGRRGDGFQAEEVQLVFAVPVWVDRFALWYGGSPVAQGVVFGGTGRPRSTVARTGAHVAPSMTVVRSSGRSPGTAAAPVTGREVRAAASGRVLELVSELPQPKAADLFGSGSGTGNAAPLDEWSSDTDDEPGGRHILLWMLLLGLAAAGTWWIRWQQRHGRR